MHVVVFPSLVLSSFPVPSVYFVVSCCAVSCCECAISIPPQPTNNQPTTNQQGCSCHGRWDAQHTLRVPQQILTRAIEKAIQLLARVCVVRACVCFCVCFCVFCARTHPRVDTVMSVKQRGLTFWDNVVVSQVRTPPKDLRDDTSVPERIRCGL